MPKFKYVARDKYGVVREDVIYAPDAGAAQMELEKKGFEEIKLQIAPSRELKFDIDILKPKVKEKDLALFTRQLGAMISAGVGIAEALEILAEQMPNKTLAKALKEVQQDVVSGMSLSKAMAKHRKVFPEFLVNLIESAEESGNLDVILQRATTYYEKIAAIKRKIVSASWYPAMVVVIATVIVLGILTFIVPTFAQLYSSMGGELPFLTQMLIDASNFVKSNILFIIGGIFGLVILNKLFYNTRAGKEIYHRIFLHMPLLGNIFLKGAIAKFARTLSTLVAGGVPIMRSLEISSSVAGNVVIEKAILESKDKVEKGQEIYKSLDPKVFPPILIAMVRVGEDTGRLDEMLDTIANFFEDEVDRAVEGLISTIEPLLMVFIGTIVGIILIGLYLPIFKMGELVK
ncbi:type II secretion system F family protein [Persephonella atlantica]|uniref:Type II secretion system F family protein n=1 Tax=Persephonella atlantica TaxID=2699429 RepID=A0ABS1GJD6_9AQUI|nr:type II secretion system F family protein [Persephonella atlantica]MBK3333048.1 type II secretion system F family protein [Persephonella atlantica]